MRRLLIRPGAIGDVIVSLPALEVAAQQAAYSEVWVPGVTVPLVTFANRVRSIAGTGLDLLELGLAPSALVDRLRGFDSIYSWYGTARPDFRAAVSDLPVRFFPALPGDSGQHAVDYYLTQVGAEKGDRPRFPVDRRKGAFVAVHPFSGSARKNWPIERFAELARRVNGQWCEGPEPGRYRFDDLGELARWLAGAAVYVGNDSGITHLAAAVGTPVVVLFGPSNADVWQPRGPYVKRMDLTAGVDEVERAVLDCMRCGQEC